MKSKATDRVFADTAKVQTSDKVVRAQNRRIAGVTRLMKNADFREWLFEVMYELCAFGDDMGNLDDFNSGKRAAGAFIRRTLLIAEEAPQYLAEIDKRYYEGVRRGMVEAMKKSTSNEGIR